MHAARHIKPALVALFLTAFIVSATAQRRSPAHSADAFVGTWILNLEKSTYENQPKPKSVLRTFDYERDGMILVTAHTLSATGTNSFTHYLFTLDGKEYEEMSRNESADRTPTFVSVTKGGDRMIKLVFKSGGRVTIQHEWTVSDDGKTLTMKRTATPAQGPRAYSVQVYDKQ
jgi:alpha-glucosidase (family GH31 glycosyl hydrolase)